MKVTSIALAISSTLVLSACGGGDSSEETTNFTSISGKAIDGYVVGATVYLDLNYNNKRDSGEPYAITTAGGNFDIVLDANDASCSDYVPTIVDVPVGAIDEDLGEITEAYQMVIPPNIIISSNTDIKNITPLTTVLWSTIERELRQDKQQLSCKTVKEQSEIRSNIQNRLLEQEKRLAQRYGVTADELYGDFIASGNAELHDIAVALVPSLKKSYQDTIALEKKHPDAWLANVEYYQGPWSYNGDPDDKTWHKEETVYRTISDKESESTKSIYEVSDDLSTIIRDVHLDRVYSLQRDGIRFSYANEFEQGGCTIRESIAQNSNPSYQISNTYADSNQPNLAACSQLAVADTQHLNQQDVEVEYNVDNISYRGYFSYSGNSLNEGEHFLNLKGNLNNITASDLNIFNFISTDFSDTSIHSANSAWRSYTIQEADRSVNITRDLISKKFHKSDDYFNGIHKEYCSDDGSNWTPTNNINNCF
ncbi:hypothetical protein C0W54_18925 [Photobacterium kishitanii]|uniref:hypothetical protein n=1 Tax=Photobacterium kishitanii TaxID=318456 RepID=UPI000D172C81|nr:hypothetical protein [Photobacterium kishitanii]PSW59738.1 hypothetical protein C0W54_18925 [Photobacterium kishitanii]